MGNTIVIKRTTPSTTQLEFRWKGGPYIEIFWGGGEPPRNVDVHHETRGQVPFNVIGVYDYAKGKVEIEDAAGVESRADEWLENYSGDYGLG
jgi:hypothetical protein